MRHLQSSHCLLWSLCLCGLAGSAWAQEPTPVTPAPTTTEPAPATARPPAAPPTPEPGSALAALLGLPNPNEPAAQAAPAGEQPVANGFVIGASLGVHLALATGGSPQPSVQPGLAVGGKIGRVVLSVGAEFTNLSLNTVAEARTGGATTTVSQSISTFLVVPGVQLAIVRSRDGRVELLGSARFGLGAPTNNTSHNPALPPDTSTLSTTQFSFMYEVGPGVRYWPHRHFALNLLAGFRGDYLFESTGGSFPKDPAVTSVTTVNNSGLNGIFASLGGMGVF